MSQPTPRSLDLALPEDLGFGRGHWVRARYRPPVNSNAAAAPLVVCLPGGTYTSRYFDLVGPGLGGYSMSAYLASKGVATLAVDLFGTGRSSRPDDGDRLTLDELARVHHAAVGVALATLGAPGALVGLGHSLGAAVTVHQQAGHHTYEQVALLGFSHRYNLLFGGAASVQDEAASDRARRREELLAAYQRRDPHRWKDPYVMFPRQQGRALALPFPVPPEVVAADDDDQTVVPRGAAVDFALRGVSTVAAEQIDVPVFLGFGVVDATTAAHREPGSYPRCPRITLRVLAGSGHGHNYAPTRVELWDELAAWTTDPAYVR
jgi:hypothetical protein